MAGLSLVELMIAIAIGLVIMAALTTLFAHSSRTREELERNSRQIENGRFALELVSSDLRLAGFYGELDVRSVAPPTRPCGPRPSACTCRATTTARASRPTAASPT
jgi:type IV pilus assembly protein PilW